MNEILVWHYEYKNYEERLAAMALYVHIAFEKAGTLTLI